MALPKETRDRIVAEAAAKTGFKDDEDSTPISKGHYYGYIAGATAESEKAQGLAEDIQLMLDQFALNPEESWFEIAHKMKGIGLDALRKFRDGKGKESVVTKCDDCGRMFPGGNGAGKCKKCKGKEVDKSKGPHSGNEHQWQDDWDMDEQGELNEETD